MNYLKKGTKMNRDTPSVEELGEDLYYATMCSAQHRGYPCNSCFHTIIEADYGHLLKKILTSIG